MIRKYYNSLGRFRALYVIAAIELLLMCVRSFVTGEGTELYNDSIYYYDSYDVIITGKPDISRTPLYPLLIGVTRDLFGVHFSVAIVYMIQSLVFLFSIRWIGLSLDNIAVHKRISYWFTAVYAIYPGILSFCGVLMTESLAVSLVSAVLYLTSEAYYRNSPRMALKAGLVSILLWMLRPSLMPISILLTLMWTAVILLGNKRLKTTALRGFFAAIASIAFLGIYAIVYQSEYDKLSVSQISTMNNFIGIRQAKIIDVKQIENPGLRVSVDSLLKADTDDMTIWGKWWDDAYDLCYRYGLVEFDKLVNDQIKSHPKELLEYLYVYRLETLLETNCIFTGRGMLPMMDSVTRLIRVGNGTAFLIFLIGVVLLAYFNIKTRIPDFYQWLLYAMFAANYFTVLVGAPNDFPRLLSQNYPVLIAVSCLVLDQLTTLAIKGGRNVHTNVDYSR